MQKFKWPNMMDDTRPKGFRATAFEGPDMEKDASSQLNMTMGHVMSFARVLVALLTPLIGNKSCPIWQTLCLHSKVLVWLLRSSFMEEELVELQRLVLLHATMQAKYHPMLAGKPKWHMCLHAVHEIRKFGPPRGVWTLKFENKHQQVKAALPLMNFKSLIKTVGELSSMWLAMNAPLVTTSSICNEKSQRTQSADFCISRVSIIYGSNPKTVQVSAKSPYVDIFHRAGAPKDICDFGCFVSTQSVRLRGHRYNIGSGIFLPSMRRGESDRFGRITTILMSQDEEQCVLLALPMLLKAPESDFESNTCLSLDPTSPTSKVFAIFVSDEPAMSVAHIFPKPHTSSTSWVILH